MVLPPRLELGSREAADFKSAVFASFTIGAKGFQTLYLKVFENIENGGEGWI